MGSLPRVLPSPPHGPPGEPAPGDAANQALLLQILLALRQAAQEAQGQEAAAAAAPQSEAPAQGLPQPAAAWGPADLQQAAWGGPDQHQQQYQQQHQALLPAMQPLGDMVVSPAEQPPLPPALLQHLLSPITPAKQPLGGLGLAWPADSPAGTADDAFLGGTWASPGAMQVPQWSAADVLPATLGVPGMAGAAALPPLLPLLQGQPGPDGAPVSYKGSRAPRRESPLPVLCWRRRRRRRLKAPHLVAKHACVHCGCAMPTYCCLPCSHPLLVDAGKRARILREGQLTIIAYGANEALLWARRVAAFQHTMRCVPHCAGGADCAARRWLALPSTCTGLHGWAQRCQHTRGPALLHACI